jgi:hypothetical protein
MTNGKNAAEVFCAVLNGFKELFYSLVIVQPYDQNMPVA